MNIGNLRTFRIFLGLCARRSGQLVNLAQLGAIFETFIVSELLNAGLHSGANPALSFYRDQGATEVDFVIANASRLAAIEAKAVATIASDFFSGLHRMQRI